MKKVLILIAVIVVSASIYIASAQTSSAPVDNNPATITAQVDEGAEYFNLVDRFNLAEGATSYELSIPASNILKTAPTPSFTNLPISSLNYDIQYSGMIRGINKFGPGPTTNFTLILRVLPEIEYSIEEAVTLGLVEKIYDTYLNAKGVTAADFAAAIDNVVLEAIRAIDEQTRHKLTEADVMAALDVNQMDARLVMGVFEAKEQERQLNVVTRENLDIATLQEVTLTPARKTLGTRVTIFFQRLTSALRQEPQKVQMAQEKQFQLQGSREAIEKVMDDVNRLISYQKEGIIDAENLRTIAQSMQVKANGTKNPAEMSAYEAMAALVLNMAQSGLYYSDVGQYLYVTTQMASQLIGQNAGKQVLTGSTLTNAVNEIWSENQDKYKEEFKGQYKTLGLGTKCTSRITIKKITKNADFPNSPQSAANFAFKGSLPIGSFNLNPYFGNQTPQKSFCVLPGNYNVQETVIPTNFKLTNITCIDSITKDSSGNIAAQTATINVSKGETVTCTFENTRF